MSTRTLPETKNCKLEEEEVVKDKTSVSSQSIGKSSVDTNKKRSSTISSSTRPEAGIIDSKGKQNLIQDEREVNSKYSRSRTSAVKPSKDSEKVKVTSESSLEPDYSRRSFRRDQRIYYSDRRKKRNTSNKTPSEAEDGRISRRFNRNATLRHTISTPGKERYGKIPAEDQLKFYKQVSPKRFSDELSDSESNSSLYSATSDCFYSLSEFSVSSGIGSLQELPLVDHKYGAEQEICRTRTEMKKTATPAPNPPYDSDYFTETETTQTLSDVVDSSAKLNLNSILSAGKESSIKSSVNKFTRKDSSSSEEEPIVKKSMPTFESKEMQEFKDESWLSSGSNSTLGDAKESVENETLCRRSSIVIDRDNFTSGSDFELEIPSDRPEKGTNYYKTVDTGNKVLSLQTEEELQSEDKSSAISANTIRFPEIDSPKTAMTTETDQLYNKDLPNYKSDFDKAMKLISKGQPKKFAYSVMVNSTSSEKDTLNKSYKKRSGVLSAGRSESSDSDHTSNNCKREVYGGSLQKTDLKISQTTDDNKPLFNPETMKPPTEDLPRHTYSEIIEEKPKNVPVKTFSYDIIKQYVQDNQLSTGKDFTIDSEHTSLEPRITTIDEAEYEYPLLPIFIKNKQPATPRNTGETSSLVSTQTDNCSEPQVITLEDCDHELTLSCEEVINEVITMDCESIGEDTHDLKNELISVTCEIVSIDKAENGHDSLPLLIALPATTSEISINTCSSLVSTENASHTESSNMQLGPQIIAIEDCDHKLALTSKEVNNDVIIMDCESIGEDISQNEIISVTREIVKSNYKYNDQRSKCFVDNVVEMEDFIEEKVTQLPANEIFLTNVTQSTLESFTSVDDEYHITSPLSALPDDFTSLDNTPENCDYILPIGKETENFAQSDNKNHSFSKNIQPQTTALEDHENINNFTIRSKSVEDIVTELKEELHRDQRLDSKFSSNDKDAQTLDEYPIKEIDAIKNIIKVDGDTKEQLGKEDNLDIHLQSNKQVDSLDSILKYENSMDTLPSSLNVENQYNSSAVVGTEVNKSLGQRKRVPVVLLDNVPENGVYTNATDTKITSGNLKPVESNTLKKFVPLTAALKAYCSEDDPLFYQPPDYPQLSERNENLDEFVKTASTDKTPALSQEADSSALDSLHNNSTTVDNHTSGSLSSGEVDMNSETVQYSKPNISSVLSLDEPEINHQELGQSMSCEGTQNEMSSGSHENQKDVKWQEPGFRRVLRWILCPCRDA